MKTYVCRIILLNHEKAMLADPNSTCNKCFFQTWLNTASTSLAHLDKVKTNVYNFGLADPRDLKATNLRNKKLQEETEKQTGDGSDTQPAVKAW